MGVKLVSSGGGSVEINPPATASNFVATMPAGTGTVSVNGVSSNIVSGTAVASTSGTSIDFTGIPSWVKRITVMFQGVSTSGTSQFLMQIGSGSFTTSGYLGGAGSIAGSTASATAGGTSGFLVGWAASVSTTSVRHGSTTLTLLNGNTWVCSGTFNFSDSSVASSVSGSTALGGTLDRVRITTIGGTDTFDAGSINILYE
jgi:hypothetical protein